PQRSNSASFTVDAASSDGGSGLQKVGFPAVSGMSGGGDVGSSPYSTSYGWSASTSASGSQTVTVTNNAGLTSSATFAVTPDTAAPSGQSAALSGGPWYTSLSVPLTLANGSDAGAGIDSASGVVQRDSATLAAGSCGSFS